MPSHYFHKMSLSRPHSAVGYTLFGNSGSAFVRFSRLPDLQFSNPKRQILNYAMGTMNAVNLLIFCEWIFW
jgi:hypothetical protein